MDDNNLMGENLVDLDLNQEPLDPPVNSDSRFGSMLNELETTHGRIEERIRQLEAVTALARQRQLRNAVEISDFSGEHVDGERGAFRGSGGGVIERSSERGKGCKRGSSYLVAKALEMNSDVKKVDKEGGSFYDCNICLEVAREPVLTCCGHLFCWVCFYQVSYIDSTSKECPVCKGEVSDSTVIPIYGNGDSEPVAELESGLKIPPRPKAQRIESLRQQQVTNGLSHVPVAEALRRIRISIGAMGDQTEGGSRNFRFESDAPEVQIGEAASRHRLRVQRVSRVLSESAASLSSLSSALSNDESLVAERLVEDLETVFNNRVLWSDAQGSSVETGNNPLTSDSAVIQSDHQALDSSLAVSSSSQTRDVPSTVVHILAMSTTSEINLPVAPSSSATRRRRVLSRVSNADNRDSRESRRRRLS
ncbi:probable GPI-anchored adhesin-like protein PGA55 [Olea europaea var. sylvestris]|uniref:probable GPI-anchored adhesin-like protein PGA55 n=1 Tax=Olea europaea var. sylvestris TaxID=158386 RepID=UPI000C1D3C1B|nr:probable GPI-anchored adhesin-like protein PGA55 [Olea europaea var. sylvestris]XP_022896524.1 probable GPI-anchored adhesin-like protein PGA55 [Olea europaea var. sylvestris]XP_022896525.1 probable GPI-anchored adhesin-like protein PGA55 [Olea europaea var. sylvestris]XP_022896526.1 probable GPI-anchored adhesin-like protein PGA55 [Olea europaea var. sylvestris]